MNTGLIFQDNPLFFLKRIFMLESQKMLPSRQQAFCFFACLPEREHIKKCGSLFLISKYRCNTRGPSHLLKNKWMQQPLNRCTKLCPPDQTAAVFTPVHGTHASKNAEPSVCFASMPADLSFFVKNQFGILSVFFISGDKDKIHVGQNTEAESFHDF